jgi:hypothetical protein
MEQKTAAGFIAIVIISILAIFAFYMASGIEISPVISGVITHSVSSRSAEELKNSLAASENLIGFRVPETLSWKRGETGSFALAIKNKYDEKRTFFFTVKSEIPVSVEAEAWMVYPPRKTVEAGQTEVINIIANPLNALPETYFFRIIACETEECKDLNSPSLYATTTFSFTIL